MVMECDGDGGVGAQWKVTGRLDGGGGGGCWRQHLYCRLKGMVQSGCHGWVVGVGFYSWGTCPENL